MLSLPNVFGKSKPALSRDAIADILRTNPEVLDAFERAYAIHALNQESDDMFQINSRQAAEKNHATACETESGRSKEEIMDMAAFRTKIVNELLAQTAVYSYDGKIAKVESFPALPKEIEVVTKKDIESLPEVLRPQLTGSLAKVDIAEPSYPHLLWFYKESKEARNQKKRESCYHHFRQGLDILDLDPITYEIIGTNPNSMGHWLPQLVEACKTQDFFKIPATKIAKVPTTLLQMTRQDYTDLTSTTLAIVDEWAHKAFGLDENKEYFIKTGTYSSKFDFRNAHVHGTKEVKELGEYLLFIHFQALQMASPLCTPCIYGVSTTNEWVVREFIPDKEGNPCIYKGLPLHTEYRVFVDCDTDQVIGIAPYWEPETMKKRFGHSEDSNSPHNLHDYVIYKAHEETLMKRYHENRDSVMAHIQDILPDLNLKGQWSIDVMQNGDDFWLIDMALAENSAFYDCVPMALRHPSVENWIPRLADMQRQTKATENISLTEASSDEFDIGITVDHSFKLMSANKYIGHAHTNVLLDENISLEWVEVDPAYRGKGYFRSVLLAIMNHFGKDKLVLEASEDPLEMYIHLGAVKKGYDDIREMTEMEICRNVLEFPTDHNHSW